MKHLDLWFYIPSKYEWEFKKTKYNTKNMHNMLYIVTPFLKIRWMDSRCDEQDCKLYCRLHDTSQKQESKT